jgi:ribosomal protein S18 acetylase RimI-like enzyme
VNPLPSDTTEKNTVNDEESGESQAVYTRPYLPSDAEGLVLIQNSLMLGETYNATQTDRHMCKLLVSGGFAWVSTQNDQRIAFASLTPVPGLDGLFDLEGGVKLGYRRKGIGTRLLSYVLRELRSTEARQVSFTVSSMESPAAFFFLKSGFFIEHEEWMMELEDLSRFGQISIPSSHHVRTYRRAAAAGLFRELYDSCFSGQAWYQPYLSDNEVSAELEDADDILFLFEGPSPVGFLWLRWPEPDMVAIEPVGITMNHRGRGLGTLLIQYGLHTARSQGARGATLGVWRNNVAAIQLYEAIGFHHSGTLSYMAINVR